MVKGKVIVMEGACDGIGKTTQYQLLKDRLIQDNESIISHHFPSYGTYHGLPVEKYLNGEYGRIEDLSPYFINSLYANDRAISWYTSLKKKFEEGQIILLDRYTTSSLIYQSALIENLNKRKEFIDYVIDFEYHKIGIKKPDHVIFLTAPFDLVTEMRKQRTTNEGIMQDIHESNLDFMKKVYENAIFIADYLSWDKVKCNDENKMRTIEDIHEEIYQLVKRRR